MAGDAPQPRGDVRFALKPMQVVMKFEEDVLRYFFRCSRVAEDAEGNRKDATLMALQCLRELLPRCFQRSLDRLAGIYANGEGK